MRILHTESSNGWGGQEIRILKESIGIRAKGHHVSLAVTQGGKLIEYARKEGFTVFPIDFRRSRALKAFGQLMQIVQDYDIDIINTHSSLDAWLGGLTARFLRKRVIRTRHLSTPIRG